jgi:hypothetical protein
MLLGSPDKVVAAAARENDHILITHNYRDFRKEVREHLESTNRKVDTLRRIELECNQPLAASRIEQELPIIEIELARPRKVGDPGVRISITNIGIRIARA